MKVMKKIKFPRTKHIGRIDLGGGIIITDKSTLPVSGSNIPARKAIDILVDAMRRGVFSDRDEQEYLDEHDNA